MVFRLGEYIYHVHIKMGQLQPARAEVVSDRIRSPDSKSFFLQRLGQGSFALPGCDSRWLGADPVKGAPRVA